MPHIWKLVMERDGDNIGLIILAMGDKMRSKIIRIADFITIKSPIGIIIFMSLLFYMNFFVSNLFQVEVYEKVKIENYTVKGNTIEFTFSNSKALVKTGDIIFAYNENKEMRQKCFVKFKNNKKYCMKTAFNKQIIKEKYFYIDVLVNYENIYKKIFNSIIFASG